MMSFLRNRGLSTRRKRGTFFGFLSFCPLCLMFSFLSCSQDRGPQIRIGVKNFEEQRIIAQMAAQLLKAEGFNVASSKTVGTPTRAIRRCGPKRSISWWSTPVPVCPSWESGCLAKPDSLSRVRRLYAEIGLVWLDALGFDNSYRVLVRTDPAAAKGLKTIGDLAKLNGKIRFACPSEYLRRPVDGLFSPAQNLRVETTCRL